MTNIFPDFTDGASQRWVGIHTNFPPRLSLTILRDSNVQMVSSILVHPILVDLKENVIDSLESEIREVSPAL